MTQSTFARCSGGLMVSISLVLIAACISTSSTPENLSQTVPKKSDRILKVAEIPTDAGWRLLQCVSLEACFLSTAKKLWKSTDGGKNWEMVLAARELETIDKVWFLDSTFGWMKTHSGWYKSADGGHNWAPFEPSITDTQQINEIFFLNQHIGWIGGAALRSAFHNELGLGGTPNVPRHLLDDVTGKLLTPMIYRTDDGGRIWTAQKLPSDLGNIQSISFVDATHGIALGGPDAFQTRDGGKTWVRVNDPETCLDPQERAIYEGKPSWVYSLDASVKWLAFDDGRMLRTTNGQTWVELQPCGSSRPIVVSFSSPTVGYGIDSKGFLSETKDGGHEWQRIGDVKYDSMTFLDKQSIWLIAGSSLFRLKVN